MKIATQFNFVFFNDGSENRQYHQNTIYKCNMRACQELSGTWLSRDIIPFIHSEIVKKRFEKSSVRA